MSRRGHKLRKAGALPAPAVPRRRGGVPAAGRERTHGQGVTDHIAVLDPKDHTARLKAVKAEGKPDGGQENGVDGGQDKGAAKPRRPGYRR